MILIYKLINLNFTELLSYVSSLVCYFYYISIFLLYFDWFKTRLSFKSLTFLINSMFFIVTTDSEASTILGMQTTWFAIVLVFLILSMGGLVTAAVLCFCRQRVPTPRHPHNAHNAQSHPPVSFPCESQKNHPYTYTIDSLRCRCRCNHSSVATFLLLATRFLCVWFYFA